MLVFCSADSDSDPLADLGLFDDDSGKKTPAGTIEFTRVSLQQDSAKFFYNAYLLRNCLIIYRSDSLVLTH